MRSPSGYYNNYIHIGKNRGTLSLHVGRNHSLTNCSYCRLITIDSSHSTKSVMSLISALTRTITYMYYRTFELDCLLFFGFWSAQLLLGSPRPRISRCFRICAQNWQQPSGTAVQLYRSCSSPKLGSWRPGPIK